MDSNKSRRIAYLTLGDRTGFFIYDHLTFPALRDLDWDTQEVPWDQAGVDWQHFAAVVIRSPWDYQKRANEFLGVLEKIVESGPLLLNDLATVRWNIHKSYLRDLERRGIPVVPTTWRESLSSRSELEELFALLNTDQIVIKPTVGANADDTFCLHGSSLEKSQVAQVIQTFCHKQLMIQPFIPAIVSEGEYSLFYFGEHYSHAVLKRPAPGDFRVQEEHGGSIEAYQATAGQIIVGQQVMVALPSPTLYARIDLVRLPADRWAVIEVELIEPSLYFPFDAEAPFRFATALDRAIRDRPSGHGKAVKPLAH